mgnify:CR=1 FL=1
MKKNLFYFLAIVLSIVFVSCEKIGGSGTSTKPSGGSNSHAGGVLNGEFSVSQTKKVRFSQGNLQYQATTKTWRFAENQYDFIGNYNAKIAETYDGWIDMFGWATSGYNDKMPTLNDRYDFEYVDELADIAGTNSDWGVYNAISNGGNEAGLWRTLTIEEWQYILEQRPDAEAKKAVASINGNNGVIILPDNWICPIGIVFTAGGIKVEDGEVNTNIEQYSQHQTFNSEEWSYLEQSGAVFLPAAGDRYGSYVNRLQESGKYWAPQENNASSYRGYLDISTTGAGLGGHTQDYYYGYSVRLVKDVVTE